MTATADTTITTIRAAAYCRISQDSRGDHLGVDRQRELLEELAARKGWLIVDHYIDNDVSAYSRKPRPQYERLSDDIRAGAVDAVLVVDTDRLVRHPRELEDVIDFADQYGTKLATAQGDIDLSTSDGRASARIMGVLARQESEKKADRQRRKIDHLARNGQRFGARLYGWQRVYRLDASGRRCGFDDVIDDHAAGIVRWLVDEILAGRSAGSLAAELNERGEKVPENYLRPHSKTSRRHPDAAWSHASIRKIVTRPANVGLVVHNGAVLADVKAVAPALVAVDDYYRVCAIITAPARRSTGSHRRPGGRRWLLSFGVASCGACGAELEVHARGTKGNRKPTYCCRKGCVARNCDRLDQYISEHVAARLAAPDARAALAPDDSAYTAACAEIDALQSRLAVEDERYATDEISRDSHSRITARLRARLADAERQTERLAPKPIDADLFGELAAERFDAAPIEIKRAAVEALGLRVVVHRNGQRAHFDPRTIEVHWPSE